MTWSSSLPFVPWHTALLRLAMSGVKDEDMSELGVDEKVVEELFPVEDATFDNPQQSKREEADTAQSSDITKDLCQGCLARPVKRVAGGLRCPQVEGEQQGKKPSCDACSGTLYLKSGASHAQQKAIGEPGSATWRASTSVYAELAKDHLVNINLLLKRIEVKARGGNKHSKELQQVRLELLRRPSLLRGMAKVPSRWRRRPKARAPRRVSVAFA